MVTTTSKETLTDLDQELELLAEYLTSEDASDRTIAEEIFSNLLPRLDSKIDAYVKTIKWREFLAAYQAQEAERLSKLTQFNQSAIKWLKARLQDFMERRVEQLGEAGRKLEGKLSKVSLCSNGGKPPVWVNPELAEADFPTEFLEYVPRLNRLALVDATIAAGELRDARGTLIAKVMPKGKHLRLS